MGQIIFHCSNCGTKLSAELDEIGAEFECPQCQRVQTVPGSQSQPTVAQTSPGVAVTTTPPAAKSNSATATRPGVPVVHVPKRKIVMSTSAVKEEEDDDDEYVEEIGGGTGLALAAVALGTTGLLLCVGSMVWVLSSGWWEKRGDDWAVILMVCLALFIMGLMGLVIAQLSRLVVRLADRVAELSYEDEE